MGDNSTIFKAIQIAILILTILCLLQSVCLTSDLREVRSDELVHSVELYMLSKEVHDIGGTVRAPYSVALDMNEAKTALKSLELPTDMGNILLQMQKKHNCVYDNGLLRIPEWISNKYY